MNCLIKYELIAGMILYIVAFVQYTVEAGGLQARAGPASLTRVGVRK